MSGPTNTRPKAPEGKARFVNTRQKEPKDFVGYKTTWGPFQKEVEYTSPKKS